MRKQFLVHRRLAVVISLGLFAVATAGCGPSADPLAIPVIAETGVESGPGYSKADVQQPAAVVSPVGGRSATFAEHTFVTPQRFKQTSIPPSAMPPGFEIALWQSMLDEETVESVLMASSIKNPKAKEVLIGL